MTTARIIQLAWTLPALTTIGIAARHLILDLLEQPTPPADERSWS